MKDEVKKAIAKELLQLRTIDNEYTVETLAEQSGVSKDTISRYENGSGRNFDILSKIISVYGLNLKSFFDRVYDRMQNVEEKNKEE